jgi:hypothetical protein
MDLRYSAESVPPVEVRTSPEIATVYMKKADVVARNLHRLYKRKREVEVFYFDYFLRPILFSNFFQATEFLVV